jgi:hypothetical protein
MENQNLNPTTCICDADGCKDNCPHVFYQGGKRLHLIEREMKEQPRMFKLLSNRDENNSEAIEPKPLFNQYTKEKRAALENDRSAANNDFSDDEEEDYMLQSGLHIVRRQTDPVSLAASKISPEQLLDKHLMRMDTTMLKGNRKILPKFEALQINGQSIVNTTIGGFAVDLTKAAIKAKEVLPLPAVRLPVIFVDEDLNFHHHFFQGMELLLGREVVESIVSTDRYFEEDEITLFPLMSGLLAAGYEDDDTEITIFTKRVITSTFELHQAPVSLAQHQTLVVAANLWGFEYIESGMQCKEPDLKMWLSMCHNHYRTSWFNTFKSAGIPSFALTGVQDRYKSGAREIKSSSRKYNDRRIVITSSKPYDKNAEDFFDEPHRRPARNRKPKRSSPPRLAESFFGRR